MPRVYWMNESPRELEHVSLHPPLRCLRGTFTQPQPLDRLLHLLHPLQLGMQMSRSLPPPKHQASVPRVSRPANWIPVGRLPGTLPSAIPQNTEEFDHWARAAHTPDNYADLQRAHDYVHYINEVPPVARSPLMIHALASWRLPSWLPEEQ